MKYIYRTCRRCEITITTFKLPIISQLIEPEELSPSFQRPSTNTSDVNQFSCPQGSISKRRRRSLVCLPTTNTDTHKRILGHKLRNHWGDNCFDDFIIIHWLKHLNFKFSCKKKIYSIQSLHPPTFIESKTMSPLLFPVT